MMMPEYELNRYSAYFMGWCQAFGEHESVPGEEEGVSWLFADKQVGLILPRQLGKQLFREVLGKREVPTLTMNRDGFRVGSFVYSFAGTPDRSALSAIKTIIEADAVPHLYLTSHFMYGPGARIITLSKKKPLSIIYKPVGPMYVDLV
jgi:hypothetical protein